KSAVVTWALAIDGETKSREPKARSDESFACLRFMSCSNEPHEVWRRWLRVLVRRDRRASGISTARLSTDGRNINRFKRDREVAGGVWLRGKNQWPAAMRDLADRGLRHGLPDMSDASGEVCGCCGFRVDARGAVQKRVPNAIFNVRPPFWPRYGC